MQPWEYGKANKQNKSKIIFGPDEGLLLPTKIMKKLNEITKYFFESIQMTGATIT